MHARHTRARRWNHSGRLAAVSLPENAAKVLKGYQRKRSLCRNRTSIDQDMKSPSGAVYMQHIAFEVPKGLL